MKFNIYIGLIFCFFIIQCKNKNQTPESQVQKNQDAKIESTNVQTSSVMKIFNSIDSSSQTPFTDFKKIYQNISSQFSPEQNDSLFLATRALAAKELFGLDAQKEQDTLFQEKLNQALSWLSNEDDAFIDIIVTKFDSTKYVASVSKIKDTRVKTFLLENWKKKLIIDYVEGYWRLKYYPSMMSDLFQNKCTPAINEFLQLSSKYDQQKYADDGGLIIEPKQLVERVFDWENHLKKFPNSILKEELNMMVTYYTRTVFAGMDNTPAFDYNSFRLNSDYFEAWLLIKDKYPESNMAKILNTFDATLKSESYTLSENATYFSDLDATISKFYSN